MESMEEIYQNHSKKVYTFLLSKTCNHELAEELTQETFFSSQHHDYFGFHTFADSR